jgi:hypothetical protein
VFRIIRQTFPGASPDPVIAGTDPLSGTANFFTGSDPSDWQTGVPTFGAVEYRDLYPGINLRYKGIEGMLKREFIVAPGAEYLRQDLHGLAADARSDEIDRPRSPLLSPPHEYTSRVLCSPVTLALCLPPAHCSGRLIVDYTPFGQPSYLLQERGQSRG